jgi:ABC-type branched-subunit amino acid transport system substrate-binding protein
MRVGNPLLIVLCAVALLAAACADPVVPTVTAPEPPTAVPEPTPTATPVTVDQPTPTPAPFEGEPGLTATEIRIGVVFDVGAGDVADQMSASAAQAVEAWAASINEAGGLAGGRTIIVERLPTSPLLVDHAEVIDLACNRDLFALVGSSALFDGAGIERLEASDCRLPDFPATVSSVERLESAVTTVSNPIRGDVYSAGWARHYTTTAPDAVTNAAMMSLDVPVSVISGSRMIEAAAFQGFEFTFSAEVPFTTDFTAEAAELAEAAPDALIWPSDGGRLITLLNELDAAEVDIPIIDCGQACYSRAWVDAAGSLGNGVSVWLPTQPLEEADVSAELPRYLFFLGNTHRGAVPTSVGVSAWASALLFEEAVRLAVMEDTPEYDPTVLTRSTVLRSVGTITVWNARELHGDSNPAAGVPSSCFVLMTLVNGTWERTFPERRGEFDCAAENLVPLTITTSFGAPDPTATPVETPDDDEGDGEDE